MRDIFHALKVYKLLDMCNATICEVYVCNMCTRYQSGQHEVSAFVYAENFFFGAYFLLDTVSQTKNLPWKIRQSSLFQRGFAYFLCNQHKEAIAVREIRFHLHINFWYIGSCFAQVYAREYIYIRKVLYLIFKVTGIYVNTYLYKLL